MGGAGAALGLALLLTGCRPETRRQLLGVFFTGIDRPPPRRVEAPAPARTNAPVASFVAPDEPVIHFHQPYFERQCAACHVSAMSQELRLPGGDLCLECHGKLIGKARFVHPPVDEGRCTACHHPHESQEPFLLTRRGQAVCLECHQRTKLARVKAHATIGERACQDCHDPHRSDLKKLLKAAS